MMNREKAAMILQDVNRYISLAEDEKEFFASLLIECHLKRKQTLLQAGDICKFENFVLSGCLRAFYFDREGFEHVVQFALEGWWISDLYSLMSGDPSWLTIDALEDSEILKLHRQDLEDLYIKIPKFERFFRIKMQNAFIAHQKRLADNIALSAEERYQNFVQKYPAIEQRIAQKQIASYIGVTPEFLSSIKKNLTKKR